MKIKIWGARGSIPSPLKPDQVRAKIYQAIMEMPDTLDSKNPDEVRAYVDQLPALVGGTASGNTACVEIQAGRETFIIDAGSGLRELGLELMKGPCGQGKGVLHLFFSHAHWDHIQGFPFFRPAFVPGNKIYIYHVHPIDWESEILAAQQRDHNFPVPLTYLQADLEFIHFPLGQTLSIGQVTVSNSKMLHPGDSFAFRFEDSHSVFVYASDAEYKLFNPATLQRHLDFFKSADVLIFDSQLTLREATIEKEDWGHSSALIGVDLARRAGVQRLVLFHHDPTDTDEDLLQVQAEAIEYQAQDPLYPACEVVVAYEGLEFDLAPPSAISLERLPEHDEAAILRLSHIFDERRVDEFEAQLAALDETGWPSRLIIDLTEVNSLAVVGLKPLISLRREHPNTLIALVGMSDRVRRVIKLTGFLDFFAIFPSVEVALAAPRIRDTIGLVFNNRYQIEDEVAEGWLGVVFKAIDMKLNRRIAVKVLSASFSQSAINQFLYQAGLIMALEHPNIVKVFECNRENDRAYIAQELVVGQTLYDALNSQPNRLMPLDQAINIGMNIARALEYAHGRGVIHGDLRPKNIFLIDKTASNGGSGRVASVKLTDFGLGRLREGYNLLSGLLVLRTAHYLAPEQILGRPLDARTDLYAFGVILYELVTGRPPFEGADQAIMQAHLNHAPPPPRRLNPHISRSLEHFILKLLAKEPKERYPTAHQTQRILNNLGIRRKGDFQGLSNLPLQQQRPLVGREEPLQDLLRAWEAAHNEQGQLLFIAGETGIGKTRLAQELAVRVQAGTLLVGNCHALEGSLAYQPFIEALRTYFATESPEIADSEVGRLLSDVARLIPEIHALLPGLPEATPLEPRQEQLRLMNSLAQYMQRATQERPWLLILDDLHWADQGSLQLLHYLARHCGAMRLLIVATYRDTDLVGEHPLLETLRSLQIPPQSRTLTLSRLNQEQVGRLLKDIWGEATPPPLIDKIYEGTEGNPFYVEEVAKGLVDDGTVTWEDGRWHFATLGEIRLPRSVRDAVLRRIAYLGQETQMLLRRAAVLGRTFSFDDLREMSDLSEWVILEHLDIALERQLIEEAPGETMLRFNHAEIQQVLYQELSVLRRRLLHRQAGEAIELRYLADPRGMAEELAHHFYEAGEFEKALIYSIQAARQADDAYASQTALMWYSRALTILKQLDLAESTQLQKFDLLLARERLYGRQGMRDKQATDLTEAQSVAESLNDPVKLARVHNQLSYYYRLINSYEQAKTHARLALEAARRAENEALEGESLSNLAYIEQDQGLYNDALENLEAARDILRRTSDRRGEAIVLKGLGTLYSYLNDYEQAQAYFERALAMNRTINNRRGESACLNNLGELEREQGNYPAARAYYEQTLSIDQTIGDRQGEAIALTNLSLVYLALGDYDTAKTYIERAKPIFHSVDDQLGEAEVYHILSAISFAQNDYDAAHRQAEEALNGFRLLNSPAKMAEVRLMLAMLSEATSDLDAARDAYIHTLEHRVGLGEDICPVDARAGLAAYYLALKEIETAQTEIKVALTWLQTHDISAVAYPFRFYLIAYQVLQQAGQSERAIALIEEGHTLLQNRAACIEDEALRRSFLENVAQNRALVMEWARANQSEARKVN